MSQIQLKRGSADSWTTQNPTLAEGQIGLEKHSSSLYDTEGYNIKIGDGSTTWTNLPYFDGNLQYLTNESNQSLDLNDVTDPGNYILNYTGSPTLITNKPTVANNPSGWPWKFTVIKVNNNKIFQQLETSISGASPAFLKYQRCTANGGGSWNSWSLIAGSAYSLDTMSSSINTINSTLNNFEWGQVGTDVGSQPTLQYRTASTSTQSQNINVYYNVNGNAFNTTYAEVTIYGVVPAILNVVPTTFRINNILPYPMITSESQKLFFIGNNMIGVLDNNDSDAPYIRLLAQWVTTGWQSLSEVSSINFNNNFSFIVSYLTTSII